MEKPTLKSDSLQSQCSSSRSFGSGHSPLIAPFATFACLHVTLDLFFTQTGFARFHFFRSLLGRSFEHGPLCFERDRRHCERWWFPLFFLVNLKRIRQNQIELLQFFQFVCTFSKQTK